MKKRLSIAALMVAVGLSAWDLQLEITLPFEDKSAVIPLNGSEFSATLPELSLTIAGKISEEEHGITGNIAATDNTGQERAVILKLNVLLPGSAWRWHYDPNESAECETGKRYFEIDYTPIHTAAPGRFVSYNPEYKVDSLGIDGERTISIYPYSCVEETVSQASYSLGFPLAEPRVYQIAFVRRQDGTGELSLTVELGLSPETEKFPSCADFSFFLEKLPDGSGFREAIAAYYRRYPEYIQPRTAHAGIWTLWMNDQVFAPWDFGIGWNQVDTATPCFNEDGTPMRWQKPTYLYTEPWGYYQLFPGRKGYSSYPVTTEDMKRELAESCRADPEASDFYVGHVKRRTIAEAVLNSACEVDPEGNWQSNWWVGFGMRGVTDETWIWENFGSLNYSMIICNPDPKLPPPNRGSQSMDVELAELDQAEFAGAQLDSFNAFAGMLNGDFKRDHWHTTTIPLVISHRYRQPTRLHYFAALEYLHELRHRHPDKLIGANTWLPWTTFLSPYVDAVGAGENSILGNENRWFLNIRALAPAKMISVLDYNILMASETGDEYEQLMRPRFEAGLLYAIFPGTGDGWNQPERVERARPLYREYMPLYQTLSLSPWNPIPGVTSAEKKIQIERFGNLICVYNHGASQAVSLVSKDSDLQQVYDLRTLETIPVTDGSWKREIPSQSCQIYFVGTAEEWESVLETLRERNREALRLLEKAKGTPEQIAEARQWYQNELRRINAHAGKE